MNFTIEGRRKLDMPDVQRSWMWELLIPSIKDVTCGIMSDVEDLIIRVRSAVIPSRGNESITSDFMGMKQFFPGKPTFGNTFAVEIEETEDQIVWKSLNAWNELIFNTNPNSPMGGSSQKPMKRDVAKDVFLIMYAYNQRPLDKKVRFFNCFPQSVGDVTMSYTGNEQVKFSCTFQFDFWQAV